MPMGVITLVNFSSITVNDSSDCSHWPYDCAQIYIYIYDVLAEIVRKL